jgi:hypothetical protein
LKSFLELLSTFLNRKALIMETLLMALEKAGIKARICSVSPE